MAKTNFQDPGSTEVRSTHISGLQEAVNKIEESLVMDSVAESNVTLSEVYISEDDRYRIYQAPAGKRNWLNSPAPVIKKNGGTISTGFTIDYGGGAVIFNPALISTDTVTASFTRTKNTSGFGAHLADYIRQPGYGTTGGTSTVFTLTLDPVLSAYTAGTGIVIKLHTDCGDNPTINVNAKGAKALKKHDGTAYSAGELASGGIYMFRYDGTSFINVIPEVPEGAKNNYTAITNPTPNDDSGDGYSVGSIWINTIADLAFICLDATAEAAVWSVFAKSSEGYYYDDGVEYISWVDGLKEGTFVLSKESDHLYASCTGGGPSGARALHVTDVMVDLTNINTLKVKLNAVGQGGSDNTAKYVIVYISKVKGDASYDARVLSSVPGARTESIDVSGLTGSYYIKVGSMHASQASGTSSAEFYKIWGE